MAALEPFLLPSTGSTGEATNEDYRRIVLLIAAPALMFFIPSLALAGVPARLWLPFILAAAAAGIWISVTFLFVPRTNGVTACVAAAGNALAVAALGSVYHGYYHEVTLLYALLVASHAVVHGLAPALVAVVLGPILIPLAIDDRATANPTDSFYAGLYLLGAALIPWVGWRLAQRRSEALRALQGVSETERSRLAAILASMADAVVVVDPEGQILVTNTAYDRLFRGVDPGPGLADERGRRLPASRWPQVRAARGASFDMSFTMTTADGERRWFEATGRPISGTGGLSGGVVAIRDITDRSLRRQQEEFVATASHELRTPVAALHGYLQLLERNLDPAAAPREADYAKSALGQTRRLGRLLDRLFDLARLQTGRLDVEVRTSNLVPIVRRAVAAAESLTQQRLELHMDGEVIQISADAGRLEEVILNVLGNAINHAPGSPVIRVRVTPGDRWVAIQIEDEGPGIPQAELEAIFSRNSVAAQRMRQGSGGLGLGLYISRELMRAQHGTIEISSVVGIGTTALLRVALASAVAPRRARRPAA